VDQHYIRVIPKTMLRPRVLGLVKLYRNDSIPQAAHHRSGVAETSSGPDKTDSRLVQL
jgi:hypothetical protein